MATWTSVVTDKGAALQAKQIDGATITFTKIVSGTGSVSLINLKEQSAITDIKQTLSMEILKMGDKQYTITVNLSNSNVINVYRLSQIGFYANDPDEGEILFAIAQIDEPKTIPTHANSPGYNIEFAFTFKNDNNSHIEITPDFAAYMTMGGAEELINQKLDDSIELGTIVIME